MSEDTTQNRMRWWREARFGMFIHWGVYAIPGRGEWVYYQERWDAAEYAKLADQFNPRHFDAREWVRLAQDAGMKYMVLTTRHHDGFCLFDSAVSDFTAPKTAARRDFIAEYADACHELGMPMGFYYSLEDWRFPGQLPHGPVKDDRSLYEPMVEQAHAQVRELMSNYGAVDILWYDGGFPSDVWRADELNAMVRERQPGIIINNRSGPDEDFGTPENQIRVLDRPWEACYTMNDWWGYAEWDRNYKTPTEILHLLSTCAAGGGNLLLNVGPDPDGRIPPTASDRLRHIGAWMRTNGASVYGTTPSPVVAPAVGWTTLGGRTAFTRGAGPVRYFRWRGSVLAL